MTGEFEKIVHERIFEEQLGLHNISMGVPIEFFTNNFGVVVPPNTPHVFYCDTFHLLDNDKSLIKTLSSVTVMLGHGITTGQRVDDWRFLGTRKSVEETYRTYAELAVEMNMPPINIVVSCRPPLPPSETPTVKLGLAVTEKYPPAIATNTTAYIVARPDRSNIYTKSNGVSMPVSANWNNIEIWQEYRKWHGFKRSSFQTP